MFFHQVSSFIVQVCQILVKLEGHQRNDEDGAAKHDISESKQHQDCQKDALSHRQMMKRAQDKTKVRQGDEFYWVTTKIQRMKGILDAIVAPSKV